MDNSPVALQSIDRNDLENIRLIDFDNFKDLHSYPRYPENKDITTLFEEFTEEHRDNSIIIYISHCWLRGWPGAEGWDGRPHPDNVTHDKFKLCIEGISMLLNELAPKFAHCYVWLDFGCINQDADPAGELRMLDKIIQICDCIFTPVFNKYPKNIKLPDLISNFYEDYKMEGWTGTPYCYMSRGWCRIEMFYAANIPLLPDNSSTRIENFKAGLAFHRKQGRRPHVLYSSYQKSYLDGLKILPPLQNSHFEKFHPAKGTFAKESDRHIINQLIDELKPYMTFLKTGYEGNRNAYDKPHGHGTMRYENGDVYVGFWENGNRAGQGRLVMSHGDIFEGTYVHNMREGHGTYWFASGDRFEGEYIAGKIHGPGIMYFAGGERYEGMYANNRKCGHGTYWYASGDVYVGNYVNNQRHGLGKYSYANGDEYEGEYVHGAKSGHGRFTYANGYVYEGAFLDNVKNGRGKLTHPDGSIHEGEWNKDVYQQQPLAA